MSVPTTQYGLNNALLTRVLATIILWFANSNGCNNGLFSNIIVCLLGYAARPIHAESINMTVSVAIGWEEKGYVGIESPVPSNEHRREINRQAVLNICEKRGDNAVIRA